MLPPFDYFEHVSACKRKQRERADRITALPASYKMPLSQSERDILNAPIDELVKGVQDQSIAPKDVLHAYSKAALSAHDKTNCLTEVMIAEAESWITNGDINLKGPLAGIPVSLKDSIIVGGFDVSVAYSRNTGKPYPVDGSLVRLLKAAGAVPFVKTALPVTLLSFESTNDVWGRCTNPHNNKYSPGGSTGGEGALLASGGSRIGVGSDVAGSVRAPAHYSGCYSLRCSTGRWPKMGVNTSMAGQEGIPSVFSPMARTLSDLQYFTRSFIQLKPWKFDHSVHPIEWRQEVYEKYSTKKLRIGVLRTDGVVDPSPACARALETTVRALKAQGHTVFNVMPPSPYEGLAIASTLLNSDGTKTFRSHFRTGETDDPGARAFGRYMRLPRVIQWVYWAWTKYVRGDKLWAGLIENWQGKSSYEQWRWVAKRETYRSQWHDWWNQYIVSGEDETADGNGLDALLTPVHALPALPHDAMKSAAASCGYTFLFNLLDYTAGVLPVTHVDAKLDGLPEDVRVSKMNGIARGAYKHYDAEKMEGLPVTVQIVGRRLEEEKVLAIMNVAEKALASRSEQYRLLEPAA